jgi:hypothetical protein
VLGGWQWFNQPKSPLKFKMNTKTLIQFYKKERGIGLKPGIESLRKVISYVYSDKYVPRKTNEVYAAAHPDKGKNFQIGRDICFHFLEAKGFLIVDDESKLVQRSI